MILEEVVCCRAGDNAHRGHYAYTLYTVLKWGTVILFSSGSVHCFGSLAVVPHAIHSSFICTIGTYGS